LTRSEKRTFLGDIELCRSISVEFYGRRWIGDGVALLDSNEQPIQLLKNKNKKFTGLNYKMV